MTSIIFLWLPFCIAVGMFASIRRDRSGFGWFLFSFFLSPLLGIIFVAILQRKTARIRIMPNPHGGPVLTVSDLGYQAVARELEI